MKILHLNYTDIGGGAAIATLNLVKEQNKNGIDARIGVIQKKTVSPFVFSIVNKKFIMNLIDEFYFGVKYVLIYLKFLNSISPFLFFKTTNGIQHSKNNKPLTDIKWINNPDFDIVHLHWINCDMLFVNDIAKIKKPNVLENDNRYQSGYYRNSKSKSMHGIDLCRVVREDIPPYSITYGNPAKVIKY